MNPDWKIFLVFAVTILIWGLTRRFRYPSPSRTERAAMAGNEFDDLCLQLVSMKKDGCYSLLEWRELLPICRFVDRSYRELCGPLAEKYSCEYFALIELRRLQGIPV